MAALEEDLCERLAYAFRFLRKACTPRDDPYLSAKSAAPGAAHHKIKLKVILFVRNYTQFRKRLMVECRQGSNESREARILMPIRIVSRDRETPSVELCHKAD